MCRPLTLSKGSLALGCHDQPTRRQEEKTMIFHINRATYKADLSEEERRAGGDMIRQVGATNPAAGEAYVVGPELGGGVADHAPFCVPGPHPPPPPHHPP